MKQFYTIIKLFSVGLVIWLSYLSYSIYSYPVGSLSDKADAAVVLGAAIISYRKPSPVFEERIKHAINLYQSGNIKKIIFTGGQGEGKRNAESIVARNYAKRLGVPDDDILFETESRTTRQNLIESKLAIDGNRFKSVLIISDSLHMKRAMMIANDLGINAKASATPTSRYQTLKTQLPFIAREVYFYHHYLLFNE